MSATMMDGLRAENLLNGSLLLEQIEELKNRLWYPTDESFISFDDRYLQLQKTIDGIPGLSLRDSIPRQQGARYENELLLGLEEIQDHVEKWTIKVIQFQGDLLKARADVVEMSNSFESWYFVAALEFLELTKKRLPVQNIKALASSEFTRLMERQNLGIDTSIEAIKILLKSLDSKRKMAKQKFEMGREQVNIASLQLPETLGISFTGPQFGVLDEDEEDHNTLDAAQDDGERRADHPWDEDDDEHEAVVEERGEPLSGCPIEETFDDDDHMSFDGDPLEALMDVVPLVDFEALKDHIEPKPEAPWPEEEIKGTFYKTGDAVVAINDLLLDALSEEPDPKPEAEPVVDIGQYKAAASVTDKERRDAEWAARFEGDADKLEAEGPGPTDPVLHRALIDASRSQAESLKEKPATKPTFVFADEDDLDIGPVQMPVVKPPKLNGIAALTTKAPPFRPVSA